MRAVEDDLDDLENCANAKMDLEALERLMEPEYEEVFSKVHPEASRREEAAIFSCSLIHSREKGPFRGKQKALVGVSWREGGLARKLSK